MTTAIPASEADKDRLLKEGARLLYTVAAGQFFQLGDINAWFDRYNGVGGEAFADEHYGAIGERSNDLDPLIEQARDIIRDLRDRSATAHDDFEGAVTASRQGG